MRRQRSSQGISGEGQGTTLGCAAATRSHSRRRSSPTRAWWARDQVMSATRSLRAVRVAGRRADAVSSAMDHRIGVYLRNPAPRGDGQCDKITVAFGAVAQWLERGTHNPLVVGSIPTRPTHIIAGQRHFPNG